MKLLLKNLRNGQLRFEEALVADQLELDPARFGSAITTELEVVPGDRWLQLRSRVQTRTPATCDRCAIGFERLLDARFLILAHEGDTLPAGADPDEIHLIRPEDEVLDLAVEFRDEILIAIEQPALCKPDCQGLCAGCGNDLNLEACACASQEPPASPFSALATRKTTE